MAILLVAPLVVATSPPEQVVIDWQEGRFLASTRLGIDRVDFWRYPFALDACHRSLLLDLLFTPGNLTVDVPGVGEGTLVYEFIAEVWTGDGATVISTQRISSSDHGHPLGPAPSPGAYELRLSLFTGVDVEWSARLRAWEIPTDLACLPQLLVNEVETNPDGDDAGAEWVELLNARDEAIDASGWTLRWGQNASLTLPDGLAIAPGQRVVVEIPSAHSLADEDETLALYAAFGYLSDRTPALTDAADDGRSWQRSPEGSEVWAFATATPGKQN